MDTKEKILSCAEELFYLKGYDGTGVQEIVEQAGITKPTLYYYFGSKRGLLDQLLETKFSQLLRETHPEKNGKSSLSGLRRTFADTGAGTDKGRPEEESTEAGAAVRQEAGRGTETIRQKLHRVSRSCYSFFEHQRRFYLLLTSLSSSAPESEGYAAVKPYTDRLFQEAVDMFTDSKDELGNMNGREEQFALSYIGVINQYMLWCADRGGSREEEIRQLDKLIDQYMYGIFS